MSRTFQTGRETRPLTLRIRNQVLVRMITSRMQEGQSYDQAISSYYADLQKDSTLREREFLKNKDWKQVRSTIYASILPLEVMEKGEDAIKVYIESNYPGVSKFLNRLEAVAE